MSKLRLAWRKSLNAVMLTLTGVAAFAVVAVLFVILGYLIWNGGTSLNLAFFTQLPKGEGETGGGMANAIVGSLKLLFLAAVIGLPIGLLAGVYLAEFGGKTFAFMTRYTTDLLNGAPSIVIGLFAFSVAVLPFKHFSVMAGGVALGVMVIPITVRSTEEFLRAIPNSLREGAMALGANQVEDDCHGHHSRGQRRNSHRYVAFPGARGGRDGPSHFHRLRQSILEYKLVSADCIAARDDLHLRARSLRRLASSGVGCWACLVGFGFDR